MHFWDMIIQTLNVVKCSFFLTVIQKCIKVCRHCTGWSMDSLKGWDSFIHLAIPSMLMLCAEWWTYEIGGLLSG